jgi:pilus assembly protein CpaF
VNVTEAGAAEATVIGATVTEVSATEASGATDLSRVVDGVYAALLDAAPDRPPDRAAVARAVRSARPLASGDEVRTATDLVLARVGGLGSLSPLLDDPQVSDVLVNGSGAVWVERTGRLQRTGLHLGPDEVLRLLERILAPLGLRVDRSSPIVDARLADGSRVSAVVPPLAVDGPCVAIRRFVVARRPLAEFCEPTVAALLRAAVAARRNMVVSGGTGAGKTSLCNALAAHVPAGERIVTIEDTAELCLDHSHVVRLEARPANSDGVGAVTIGSLVRAALRLRPDRIIVGEARGPEAADMLTAMNTGHEGSLSTLHANSPADALARLATMVLSAGGGLPAAAVHQQVTSAVHLVVQVDRRADGRRAVVAVAEPTVADHADRPALRPLADADGVMAAPRRWYPDTPDASPRPAPARPSASGPPTGAGRP